MFCEEKVRRVTQRARSGLAQANHPAMLLLHRPRLTGTLSLALLSCHPCARFPVSQRQAGVSRRGRSHADHGRAAVRSPSFLSAPLQALSAPLQALRISDQPPPPLLSLHPFIMFFAAADPRLLCTCLTRLPPLSLSLELWTTVGYPVRRPLLPRLAGEHHAVGSVDKGCDRLGPA